jgi:hypothetical protein
LDIMFFSMVPQPCFNGISLSLIPRQPLPFCFCIYVSKPTGSEERQYHPRLSEFLVRLCPT